MCCLVGLQRLIVNGETDAGDAIQCALKTVRSTKTVKEQVELEKALAFEVAIAFACARAVGIASVIDSIIPEPGAS